MNMNEFTDRIAAQRSVLRAVNCRNWPHEELFGLSSKAIDRWVTANQLHAESALVRLVHTASEQLFFLADKSQEQMSEQYAMISAKISALVEKIKLATMELSSAQRA